jgi:hypothetical protein
VGDIVGGFVGDRVGWSVIRAVGRSVIPGGNVGIFVGAFVGGFVGRLVGGRVGGGVVGRIVGRLVLTRVGTGVASIISTPSTVDVLYKGVSSSGLITVNQATHASKKPDSEESSGISRQSNSWSNASKSGGVVFEAPCDSTCKYLDPVTSRSVTLVLLSKNSGSALEQPTQ